ncbi:MAG TPA: hypothetical protein VMH40_09030 [Myxococcaceae bacterium]|nr:hypothetical protein [Myxococcaceae bacterium]
MRSLRRTAGLTLLIAALCASCGRGGNGGGGGGGASAFLGVWQYETGSYSFVNCYTTSRNVDLTRTGFQIVDQGKLVRIDPDGCRFTVVQSTATNAGGVVGEECTVSGTDGLGNPITTLYHLKSLVMSLFDGGTRMAEVFDLDATQTNSLGTFTCDISGSNTLDRAP